MNKQTKGVEIAGHRVHVMLVAFPIGMLAAGVLSDVARMVTGDDTWSLMAFRLIGVGVVLALASAVFGFIDWRGIPANTRAKRVGLVHGIGNVVMVVLFGVSWLLRRDAPLEANVLAVALALSGFALAGVTAWLGGELVNRYGIGVRADADVDAERVRRATQPAT